MGYHLTLVKGPSCDTGRLRQLIISTVPGSELASDVSAELTFLLPFTSSQHFPSLLDTLESQSSSFSIFPLPLIYLPLLCCVSSSNSSSFFLLRTSWISLRVGPLLFLSFLFTHLPPSPLLSLLVSFLATHYPQEVLSLISLLTHFLRLCPLSPSPHCSLFFLLHHVSS